MYILLRHSSKSSVIKIKISPKVFWNPKRYIIYSFWCRGCYIFKNLQICNIEDYGFIQLWNCKLKNILQVLKHHFCVKIIKRVFLRFFSVCLCVKLSSMCVGVFVIIIAFPLSYEAKRLFCNFFMSFPLPPCNPFNSISKTH